MSSSKVHFPVDQTQQHDSQILIEKQSENVLEVHLGFLKVYHQYRIRFKIKPLLDPETKLEADPLQNVHVRVLKITSTADGIELELDFNAHKEKILKEEIKLKSVEDKSKFIRIILLARVLGKGKGTPSLKTGIHCTDVHQEEDSEQSDWQGFN